VLSEASNLAVVRSRAQFGLEALECQVEVHLGNGLPAFYIVGLAQAEVRESKERVRAALLHVGFEFPQRRITVNLAPADIPKHTGRFDLPIALGILVASGQLPGHHLDGLEAVGELSLTGEVKAISGAIAMAWALRQLKTARALLLPAASTQQASCIAGVRLLPVHSLKEAAQWLKRSPNQYPAPAQPPLPPTRASGDADFSQVQGMPAAKRLAEIAAAGQHSLMLIGPPGCGKTMIAQRLPSILPTLSQEHAADCAALHSLAGLDGSYHWGVRPLRQPHHHASAAALIGGGARPVPGEISLAHHGVLFLDEFAEFSRHCLEALREPLESGVVSITRAQHKVSFPARFLLVAAMNPCPCGYLGSTTKPCVCSTEQIFRYRHRVSGPLLDRLDLHLQLQGQAAQALLSPNPQENSAAIAARVQQAHAIQLGRQGVSNGDQAFKGHDLHLDLEPGAKELLVQASSKLKLSSRGLTRTLKVARTIADLAQLKNIAPSAVAEALQYRTPFDQ
jgi:magnesium chelatase family protein